MKSAGSGPKNNHVCGSREQINANEEELHKDKDEKEVDGVRGRVAGPHIFGEMKDQQKTRRPAFCFSISVLFYIFSRFLFYMMGAWFVLFPTSFFYLLGGVFFLRS
eukprot:GEMP01111772.1.p1 GENE.GEMP01111772.1~~GEMP01111772.1.p1  ORF type:complete len:106 (+),score=14.19 GEMP01111772.1:259-576(+)